MKLLKSLFILFIFILTDTILCNNDPDFSFKYKRFVSVFDETSIFEKGDFQFFPKDQNIEKGKTFFFSLQYKSEETLTPLEWEFLNKSETEQETDPKLPNAYFPLSFDIEYYLGSIILGEDFFYFCFFRRIKHEHLKTRSLYYSINGVDYKKYCIEIDLSGLTDEKLKIRVTNYLDYLVCRELKSKRNRIEVKEGNITTELPQYPKNDKSIGLIYESIAYLIAKKSDPASHYHHIPDFHKITLAEIESKIENFCKHDEIKKKSNLRKKEPTPVDTNIYSMEDLENWNDYDFVKITSKKHYK
jgi:hypothetical protein